MKFSSLRGVPVTVAVIAVFVVFAAWIGGAPRSAEADVTSVASSIMVGSDGSAATITVNATDTDAVMSVTTAGGGGDDLFAFVSCAGS